MTHGVWTSSLKQQTCEKCGEPIFPGRRFLWFRYFDGREHSVACEACATVRLPEVLTFESMATFLKETVDSRHAMRAAGE